MPESKIHISGPLNKSASRLHRFGSRAHTVSLPVHLLLLQLLSHLRLVVDAPPEPIILIHFFIDRSVVTNLHGLLVHLTDEFIDSLLIPDEHLLLAICGRQNDQILTQKSLGILLDIFLVGQLLFLFVDHVAVTLVVVNRH